jgi:hypothetical protein
MNDPTSAAETSTAQLNTTDRARRWLFWLVAILALITAGLLVYSQTDASVEDEGFHLLAAHLIKIGEKPYLDFCFPQTPLNAYLNAALILIFGESWRAVHVLAALETAAAVVLTAEFVLSRFPVPCWRLPGAIAVALLVALNMLVIDFGPIAQAYGICLLLTVAAFRIAVVAVERNGFVGAALAGLLAGAAAACSLLVASACWVFLVWILVCNRVGNRVAKSIAFIAGAAIPFLPVLWLFIHGPRQVWFNLFQYHLSFRQVDWSDASVRRNDFETLTSWINRSQDLLLILLAIAGLMFLISRRERDVSRRAEFYLCIGLAAALGLQNAFAYPTFRQYFVVSVPFVAILAILGLYSIVSRLGFLERPLRAVVILAILLVLQVARSVYDEYGSFNWYDYQKVARKVDETTPPAAKLLADEQIYFLTHRQPPPGMEFAPSHKLQFSPALNAMLHIVPEAELERQIKEGEFSTIQMCDEAEIETLNLEEMYEERADYPSTDNPLCSVFWGLRANTNASPGSAQ